MNKSGLKGMAMLAGMMALMSKPGDESFMDYPAPRRTPNRVPKSTKYGGQLIRREYPEHYTQQQRGFTPAGGVKGHFPGLRSTRTVSAERIASSAETETVKLYKSRTRLYGKWHSRGH